MAKTKVTGGYIADSAITSDHLHTTLDLSSKTLTIGATTVSGHLIPDTNITYDLGSSTYRFRDIYLDGTTINLGGTELKKNSDGDIEFKSGSNFKRLVVSELEFDDGTNRKKFKISSGRLRSFDSSGSDDTADKISLASNTTDDLSEGSSNLYFTTARARSSFSASTGIAITDGAISAAAIPNSSLTNSSVTINSNSLSLGGTLTLDTDDIGEGSTNLYFTNARARGAISVSGNALSYNSSTGVLTANYEESPTFTGTVTSGAILSSQADHNDIEVRSVGDYFPSLTIARTSGTTKTNYEWNLQIGSSGYLNFKDITNGYYPLVFRNNGDVYLASDTSSANPVLILDQSAASATFAGAIQATSFSDGTISGITFIDEDSFATNSATRVPTQQSIKAYVDAQVAGVVDSAPAALNTLNELAAALGDDANFSTTTSDALGNRLRVDTASQGLTGTQQANAITNLGITATKAELNYVDGVTSNIQTQLDTKITSSDNITGTSGGLSGTPNISVGTISSGAITSSSTITTQAASAGAGIKIKRTNSSTSGARGYIGFMDSDNNFVASIDSRATGVNNSGDLRFTTSTGEAETGVYNLTPVLTLGTDQSATFAGSINIGSNTGDPFNAQSLIKIQDGGNAYIQMKAGTSAAGGVLVGDTDDDFVGGMIYSNSTNALSLYSGNAAAITLDVNQNAQVFGNVNLSSGHSYKIDSTTVIDSNLNLTNIGTISSSGNITTQGNIIHDSVVIDDYSSGTVAITVGRLQIKSPGKTGWGVGDEFGSIDFYNSDGSGIGARNAARIVAENNNGNGSTTTTFEGELAFYTSAYNSNLNASPALLLDSSNNATVAGTVIADDLDISGSLALGSTVTLSESAERADLLEISSSTSGWAGLQIRNTSNEGRWSFMTNGTQAGIYDDENNKWHLIMNENAATDLYYNANKKFETTNTGVEVTGNIVVTGTVDGVDIAARDAVLTSTTTTANAAMPKSGGTFTGGVTLSNAGGSNILTLSGTSPTMAFVDTTPTDCFYIHVNSNNFYILADRNAGGTYGAWETPHPLQLEADTNVGYLFGNRIYATDYHPEADTLTTARTIGGVSFDGSANINLPGVNTAGNQNTSGTAAGLSGTPNITVGTISSGNITSTGTVTGNTLKCDNTHDGFFGSASFSWGGSGQYPTLYSSHNDRWVMIAFPHIPYLTNGTNSHTGSTTGATMRMASNPSASAYWDVGVSNVTEDLFRIGRSGSNALEINSSLNATFSGTITSGAIDSSGTSNFDSIRLTDASRLGFGTAKAGATVGHTASVDEGIFWHTSNDYGIYRTAGAWTASNYQQLKLKWVTGIELDGGGTSYGKSGVNILNGNLKIDGTQIIDSSRNLNNINSIDMSATDTAVNYLHVPRGGGITLYGDTSVHHGIFSRNQSNAVADDILISSYGAVYIDLDSNSNNSDNADFVIGRHNSTSQNFFSVDGENGNVNIPYDNAVLQFGIPGNGSNVNGCWLSFEGNTGTDGEGSGRLFFREHNSSTGAMDAYGMSLGYRGGDTSVTTAGGNTWTGLAAIGNGQWGMWGHNGDDTGALIMYGDRAGTFVDFAGNNIQGITDIYLDDQLISTGDTDTYFQFHAADQCRIVTAGAEVMEWGNNYVKVNDNDTIRLGAGSDFRMWHNGTDHYFRNYNHAGGSIYFQGEDTEGTNHALLYMQNNVSRPYLRLFENGEERLRTTSYGVEISGVPLIDGEETLLTNANAGIYFTNGGTDGTFASHGGIARSNGASFHISGSAVGDFCISAEAGKKILFGETNAKNAEIDASGNFTATSNVTAYSDERLKDNIQTIENGLEIVKQLRGVSFTRNDIDDSNENIGVIAQEVEKVLPQVVLTHDDGIKSVSYGNMAGLFIEAIKEQQELIEKLTARIEELEK